MTSMETLHIDLKSAAREGKELTFSLSDSFFEELEQEEIAGGSLTVALKVSEGAGGFFRIGVRLDGNVRVACDRCLAEVTLPVHAADGFEVGDSEDRDFLRILPAGSNVYDIGWDIYELAVLALPARRVHDEGTCDAEMAERLEQMRPSAESHG